MGEDRGIAEMANRVMAIYNTAVRERDQARRAAGLGMVELAGYDLAKTLALPEHVGLYKTWARMELGL